MNKKNRLISILFLITFLKGLIFIFLIPPFQTPDEPNHYDYAVYLSKINIFDYLGGKFNISEIDRDKIVTEEVNHLLSQTQFQDIPFFYDEKAKIGLFDFIRDNKNYKSPDSSGSLSKEQFLGRAYNYPPLYYFYESALLRVADIFQINVVVKFLLARLFSFLLFMAALVFVYKSLKIINFSMYTSVIILTLIALQPQLSMLSISVQPDILALLLITAGLYFALKFVNDFVLRDFYLFHLSAGLLLLVKIQFFISFYPVLMVLIFYILFSFKKIDKRFLFHSLLSFLIVFVLGGWWYIRSSILYGNLLGYIGFESTQTSFFSNLFYWISFRGRLIFKSFWGVWGWLDYAYPLVLFFFFLVLSILPFPLWIAHTIPRLKKIRWNIFSLKFIQNKKAKNILLSLAPLFCYFLVMIYVAGTRPQNQNDQGRHWLPYIFPIAIYLGGCYEYLRFKSFRKRIFSQTLNLKALAFEFILVFSLLNGYMMYLTYLRYYPVP
jgi:hypothetical protein